MSQMLQFYIWKPFFFGYVKLANWQYTYNFFFFCINIVTSHTFLQHMLNVTLDVQVELKEGPLEQFTHEMEPFLRKQGMPVRLNKGVPVALSWFLSCICM